MTDATLLILLGTLLRGSEPRLWRHRGRRLHALVTSDAEAFTTADGDAIGVQ